MAGGLLAKSLSVLLRSLCTTFLYFGYSLLVTIIRVNKMSSPNKSFKKKEREDSGEGTRIEDVFDNPFVFNHRIEEFDMMMQKMLETFRSREASVWTSGPLYFGYSYSIGPDGKPHYKEWRNVHSSGQELGQELKASDREPFVDTVVHEKANTVKVIAEMPGVSKEEIDLKAKKDSIIITTTGSRKYDITVPLSVPFDSNSVHANYTNGVLELSLKLKSSVQSKGTKVKID